MQLGLDFASNPRFAIFGAEDYMRQEIGEGSAHYVAPPELWAEAGFVSHS
jgi:hypothetical protein